MTFRQIEVGGSEYRDELLLREEILRRPLGLTFTEEELAREPDCFHLGAFDDARLIAVLLLQPLDENTVKMRQVAVSEPSQRGGVGSGLITFAEGFARERGYKTIIAHARGTAVGFYLRIGYSASGEEFMETTIPHRLVTKAL
jgi:GNAT superfamily N-acetyltransferase